MDRDQFDFWQEHSRHFLEMALRNDRRARVAHPDGYGKRTGDCGDTVEMFLTMRDDHIDSVSFEIKGCLNTIACANTVAKLAEGKKIRDAWAITPEDVVAYLETLPVEHAHCAELAAGAFYLALINWQDLHSGTGASWASGQGERKPDHFLTVRIFAAPPGHPRPPVCRRK